MRMGAPGTESRPRWRSIRPPMLYLRYISADHPGRAADVQDADRGSHRGFLWPVEEFWAWIPTVERFAEGSGLGDEASEVFAKYWDIDLQMLRALVNPWPARWPNRLQDLNAAAVTAGVEIPPRAVNHLHPRVHAEWNRQLFDLIRASRSP